MPLAIGSCRTIAENRVAEISSSTYCHKSVTQPAYEASTLLFRVRWGRLPERRAVWHSRLLPSGGLIFWFGCHSAAFVDIEDNGARAAVRSSSPGWLRAIMVGSARLQPVKGMHRRAAAPMSHSVPAKVRLPLTRPPISLVTCKPPRNELSLVLKSSVFLAPREYPSS